MRRLRYIPKKPQLFKYCYLAVKDHFESEEALDAWYENLPNDERRDGFLKVAPYYLALVKNGDWYVDIPDSNAVIAYFTNTYKYIAVVSLIESLSTLKYVDFYTYLSMRRTKTNFPVDAKELAAKYAAYNKDYGAIRRFIEFFKRLSRERQANLVSKLQVEGATPSLENFAKYLYRLRSEFVHNAELIHEFSCTPTLGYDGKRIVLCYLSMTDTMEFFEEGLLAWCQSK